VTGGLLLAKMLEEAGLPPGVLSVVVSAGSDIGDAFVTHASRHMFNRLHCRGRADRAIGCRSSHNEAR
jgi:hypothetical protein